MKQKQLNVPVFLIYAGIIHAIGLALLLPIMITLPGEVAPETSIIDIEVIPARPAAAIPGQDDEETAALPSAEVSSSDRAANGADAEIAPDAQAAPERANEQPHETDGVAPATQDGAEADAEKPAGAKPHTRAKKTATRSRTSKARRAKTNTKIAPFNGALSGLFAPAPANKRR